jgi:DNA-binding transcriptional regulator YiaG
MHDPASVTKTVHPLVSACLEQLREEGDRSYASAKMRLAMKLGYNIHTVQHWAAGRRQPCADAITKLEGLLNAARA